MGFSNLQGIPQSPSPQVPDITETSAGLEWFEMGLATSSGPARNITDQGVPRSPYLTGSASTQSSPLSNFAVPFTPVQSWGIPHNLEEDPWTASPAQHRTQPSPLAQTVPVFRERRVYAPAQPVRSGSEEDLSSKEGISEERGSRTV
ncbi:hypothetical protein J4Q44_G00082730 [Coregonus suidteri]|uniref:Uncharacterized protein n=1 Tax=Coregonus suidteri TaxID=861788 RepID=A0AAN8M8C1_9TELE